MPDIPITYQTGMCNEFASEALLGALPQGRNSPQRAPYGLYAEQISGTAFTAPRHANRRAWLYRIRPSTMHQPFVLLDSGRWISRADDAPVTPNQLRWDPLPLPGQPTDFIDGMTTMPATIGDYTDFYIGIQHATAVGRLFRPDTPLLPNYKWVPIGYHGRSSSVVVSGEPIYRPHGQSKGTADTPDFGPSKRLDYELELGFFVGPGNRRGAHIPIEDAESHLFGVALFNDWSARDIQPWEYQPLGPFLSKNFASTLSPWIVTFEALAPFRAYCRRAQGDPEPLPYLRSDENMARGSLDVQLEVLLQTEKMKHVGSQPVCLSRSSFVEAAYWTPSQLLTHHAAGGCNLNAGDLLGSGTLSGPHPSQAGSLIEKTIGGREAITLPSGESRIFLEDGDTVSLRAWCEREGAQRIGFGECVGTIRAAPFDTPGALHPAQTGHPHGD